MTNTLSWGFKSIQLPKLNTNLLSVISLILLLTTVFVTITIFASHCDDLAKAEAIAHLAADAAIWLLVQAGEALADARETGIDWLIDLAQIAFDAAKAAADAALALRAEIVRQYLDCLQSHNSGSCG